MRFIYIFIINVFLVLEANAQSGYEICAEAIGYDLRSDISSIPERNSLQLFTGGMLRYKQKSNTLRFGINSSFENVETKTNRSCRDCFYGNATNNVLGLKFEIYETI